MKLPPHFRLLAVAFSVAQGAAIALRGEDAAAQPVNLANATVTPSTDAIVTVAGNVATITLSATAATGPRRVTVVDATGRKARRTIIIV